jgi:RNA polymerase sigma-32 factor
VLVERNEKLINLNQSDNLWLSLGLSWFGIHLGSGAIKLNPRAFQLRYEPETVMAARKKTKVAKVIEAKPTRDVTTSLAPVEESSDEAEVDPQALDSVVDSFDARAEPDHEIAVIPKGKSALARDDGMAAYMAEVKRHPLLSREEELSLARHYRDTQDVKTAYKLVSANLRLVVKLAYEYHRNPLSLLDLVQEGNIGLMLAVKKYDPERGVKLSSYAAWWIKAYILRYIMDNWKLVKLGTTEAQRKLFFKLRQEQDALLKQGVEVTSKLLAERLSVSEADVEEMDVRLSQNEVSLSAPVHIDDEESKGDRLLPSGTPAADETLGNEQMRNLFKEKLTEFSKGLNEREKFIFENRLIAEEPMTLNDIGAKYSISRERARQLESVLVAKIKTYMQQTIPDFSMVSSEEND